MHGFYGRTCLYSLWPQLLLAVSWRSFYSFYQYWWVYASMSCMSMEHWKDDLCEMHRTISCCNQVNVQIIQFYKKNKSKELKQLYAQIVNVWKMAQKEIFKSWISLSFRFGGHKRYRRDMVPCCCQRYGPHRIVHIFACALYWMEQFIWLNHRTGLTKTSQL